ncbi:MAG: hypothetical protein M3Y33_00570 [Actinomycetota bacterium]|nr:hypothetical protein [Actinomycetota bacterium]
MAAASGVHSVLCSPARRAAPEKFWWIVTCIVTFGGAYFYKIARKRATLEALIAAQQFQAGSMPPRAGGPRMDAGPL